jgi:histidinol-phosphate phosphatase family protein
MRTHGKRATSSEQNELTRITRNGGTAAQSEGAAAAVRRAVLLDRDGVINALVYHQDAGVIDAPFTRAQFRLLPRVPEAIRLLNDLGLRVAIVSNQPGIAKGHLKPEMLKWFDRTLLSRIQSAGAHIDRIFYCLHHPEAKVPALRRRCHCRKPGTGLLQKAAAQLKVSLSDCYMVGDGIPDMLAGKRAGCKTIFIGRWKCEICQFAEPDDVRPAFVAKDLWEACQLIRSEMTAHSRENSPILSTQVEGCSELHTRPQHGQFTL